MFLDRWKSYLHFVLFSVSDVDSLVRNKIVMGSLAQNKIVMGSLVQNKIVMSSLAHSGVRLLTQKSSLAHSKEFACSLKGVRLLTQGY
jgi:hypothetical protein